MGATVVGEITAPAAVLIRPDGCIARVDDGTDTGLREALMTWIRSRRSNPRSIRQRRVTLDGPAPLAPGHKVICLLQLIDACVSSQINPLTNCTS